MGLEWHNRRRRSDGTFVSDMQMAMKGRPVQLHIRVPWALYNRARKMANAQEMELTAYVSAALAARVEADDNRAR